MGADPIAPQMVTLVIENQGTAPAPVSFISVAPRNHLAAARHSTIPALAPGERATVQLPVVSGPDGTQCVSITISPAPARDPATAQVLASATRDQPATTGLATGIFGCLPIPDLTYWPDSPRNSATLHSADYTIAADIFTVDGYDAV